MKLHQVWAALVASLLISPSVLAVAQRPSARLAGPIETGSRATLTGSRPPRARAANDVGSLSGSTKVAGITLVFNRTDAQETALKALLTAQQNPASPQYHQWLTPETFGAQFGVADADLAKVEAWLQGQGFTIDRVSRAHDRISFTGTAAQVRTAFGAELHQYRTGTKVDYAPSSDLTLPAGLAPIVMAVTHLSTFRPHAMSKPMPVSVRPDYTVTGTQQHFLTPKDVATMYDVNPSYNAGFNGTGQTIAIAGDTYIQTSDIANFQSAAGLPANLPTLVLEPNTGASAVYEGEEFESDIDVEYSTGMAPGAKVLFVYTGDSPNYFAFDAFDYIIEENLAPVASLSYGACEPLTGQTYINQGDAIFEQGAAQGQTLIASAGDSGSTSCYGDTQSDGTAYPAATQEQLAISFPADSPNITAIGGTQMAAGTFASTNTQYWETAGSTSVINSLLSYVPEVVWNEDSATYGLASGGGGASIYFPAPSWQTGVVGIPAGNTHRLNPDISLQASVSSPGYLVCSSDPYAFAQGQTTSCSQGIYDSTGKIVTEAGGTSFGAPIFAGMMAVLNQQKHGTGQGLINPTLYSLAANSTTYASAFHDVTSGNNGCAGYAAGCGAGLNTYLATTGYDEASGLGSIDFANLVAAWPASAASALSDSAVTLTPATASPASGASDVITIQVSSSVGTPTGTVTISLANEAAPALSDVGPSTNSGATQAGTATLVNGQATYTFPGTTTAGTQVIVVSYSGDPTHAASTSSLALTLANTLIPTGSFTFTAPSITVPANGIGQGTIVVTPVSGYAGYVNFTLPSLPSADCYAVGYQPVAGVTSVTLEIGNGAVCDSSADVRIGNQMVKFRKATAENHAPQKPFDRKPVGVVLAGLLAAGMLKRRKARNLPTLAAICLLSVGAVMGITGCGGSTATGIRSTGGTGTTGTTGTTLSLTLQGNDSVTSTISYSAPITVVVQ